MSDRSSTTCAIAVMGKAPRAGRSKTRLVPTVSPEQAAALSAAFLRDTTENLALAGRQAAIRPFVAYAPSGLEPLLTPHLASGTGLVLADGTGPMPDGVEGFGRCLLQAVRDLLAAGHGSACVLNSDGPTLPTSYLVRAARLLAEDGDRAVLGAAEDGGYYLLGVKRAHAALFRDIAWSTTSVAEDTRVRARSIGLELVELPTWYDVDDGPSLHRLLTEFRSGQGDGYAAPATRACVARLGLSTERIAEPDRDSPVPRRGCSDG